MLSFLKEPFIQVGLAFSLLSGCLLSYLGVYVILRKVIFITLGLSQVACLGFCVGIFWGSSSFFSFIFVLIGLFLLSLNFSEDKIPKESLVAFIWCFSLAVSIIFISKNPILEAKSLSFLEGNLLYLRWQDFLKLSIICFLILILHKICYEKFLFISFDREIAAASGLNVKLLDFLLFISIGWLISYSVKTCGVLFVFSSLILPAISAFLISKTIKSAFFISSLLGFIGITIGFILSYHLDLPTSPTIVVLYGMIFMLINLFNLASIS